jgi:hypothetical protein
MQVELGTKKRVFTFSDRMLAAAHLGSTLVLYAATVVAREGDDVVIEGTSGPNYKVHAGYLIAVPDEVKLRPRDPVLAEWNGAMKHAVVTKVNKTSNTVRFTDVDGGAPETTLKTARVVRQVDGLHPGNYAAMRDGADHKLVLLVSSWKEGGTRRWLGLGYAGAATLIDEAALRPMPTSLGAVKPGAEVMADWAGTLRRGTVTAADADAGLVTVKFERAGRPAVLGWGRVTLPFDATQAR